MVIGVDAGALSISDERLKVGVYRVILNLLRELSKLDTENEYRLYSFRPIDQSILSQFSDSFYPMVLAPKKAWFRLRLPLSLFVHPVDVFLGVSQAVPVGLQKNIGFIYDVGFLHYPEAYPQSAKRLRNQTNYVVHHSKKIITISESSRKDICENFGISPDTIVVIYPGVDERFTKEGKKFVGKLPYFLHVGSLKPGKNIPTLIKAFAEFLQTTKKEYLLLIIGGDYWFDEEIQTTIDTYKLEKSVRLLGFVHDNVIAEYYRGASAFITTSLSEGFCLPILEAMACGVPAMGPNTGVFPEVIGDESLLFPPTDLSAIAKAMDAITSDTSVRDMAIAKGLAKSERYRWDTFASEVLHVIKDTT